MKPLLLFVPVFMFIMNTAQTQIIAHRGYFNSPTVTAENSIQALKNAQDLGVYGSEFDVRITKDGVLVVHHDEHINGIEISETLYPQLTYEKLSNGENIPTLDAYLEQGKKSKKVKLIVELKPAKTPELEKQLVQQTLDAVKSKKLNNKTEYISFSLLICKEIKQKNPKAKVLYLNGDLSPEEIKNAGLDGIDYHYSVFTEAHPDWISRAKQLKLITNAWTVNDAATFGKLSEMGVDFVTTNIPNVFLK